MVTASISSSGSTAQLYTKPYTSGATVKLVPETTMYTQDPTSHTGDLCDNGGHYNGRYCVCTQLFYGNKCEFIANEIRPTKVIVKVNITVYIVNEEFTEDLSNRSTAIYRNFSARFTEQMNRFYEARVPYYTEVRISSVSKGSIRVDHVVLLSVDPDSVREQHARALRSLSELLRTENCTLNFFFEGILCFNTSRAVINGQLDETGLCSELQTIPTAFHEYFYGVITVSNQFLCVSNCSSNSQHSIDCNHGQCLVSGKGPNCYCESSSQFWYTGDQCQVAVSKPGIYGGVAAGLTFLLIFILLLVFLLCKDNRKLIDQERNCQEDDWGYTAQDPGIVNASCALETSSENDAASITLPSFGSPFRPQSFRSSRENIIYP